MLFGYRTNETKLNNLNPPDNTYRLKWVSNKFLNTDRPPMRISLGPHVLGYANPVPDTTSGPSALEGVVKRVAAQMPVPNRAMMRRLRRFTIRFLEREFRGKHFSVDEDFDFTEWIDNTPYPLYRREELKEMFEDCTLPFAKRKIVKAFVKDESYTEYKYPRGIYSRLDEYKILVGPFFQKLGEIIFGNEHFIKKIPCDLRADVIIDRLSKYANLFLTDFSQFEATFVRMVMKIEFTVYSWFLKYNKKKDYILKLINHGMMSVNFIQFLTFAISISCKRMSGEMNTSVGNGIFNFIATSFIVQEIRGSKNFYGLYEGDDGITGLDGQMPRSGDYTLLGANIKIEVPDSISEASFCGVVCDEIERNNCTDPMEAIMSFGYTTRQYIGASNYKLLCLLRCKAMSLLYQYPGCPILRDLAIYGLRVTDCVDSCSLMQTAARIKQSAWERAQLDEMFERINVQHLVENVRVGERTRVMVEKKFKIPVSRQIEIEEMLKEKNDLEPIIIPDMHLYVHSDCSDYYSKYAQTTKLKIFNFNTAKGYRIWKNNVVFYYL